jgi:hypothetical protein
MIIQCPHCRKKFKVKSQFVGKKIDCPSCNQPFIAERLISDQIDSNQTDSEGTIFQNQKCTKCSKLILDGNAYIHKKKVICSSCLKAMKKEMRESMGYIALYLDYARIARIITKAFLLCGLGLIAGGIIVIALVRNIEAGLALEFSGLILCAIAYWERISQASKVIHTSAILMTIFAISNWCAVFIGLIITAQPAVLIVLIPAIGCSLGARRTFSEYNRCKLGEEAAANEKLAGLVEKKIKDIKEERVYDKVILPLGWLGYLGKSDGIFYLSRQKRIPLS